jgi:hypothetical protein
MHPVRGGVLLPRSSPRKCDRAHAKLLRYVDPDGYNAMGFEGNFLKPGSILTEEQLRPSLEFPQVPILLEHALAPAHGIPGHRRCDSIYILWRWEREEWAWRELARAVSPCWDWAIVLRPLAIRALEEARGPAPPELALDLEAITGRVLLALDTELRTLDKEHCRRLLGVVYDRLAARMCQ